MQARLRNQGLRIVCGPLTLAIRSPLESIARALARLYADQPVAEDDSFADFHVGIHRARGIRGWIAPQVEFDFDGQRPFKPLPLPQAFAMLEWGLNWCIASHCHQYLVVHAASLARGPHALILPGAPGAGKSTLCAALMLSGWRLLSDELTLIDLDRGSLAALARPVNLKNASIDIIRQNFPQAEFGPIVPDTLKGRLSHLKPHRHSVAHAGEPALPRWLVFPRYRPLAATRWSPAPKAASFMQLAEQAFNYSTLGERGFDTIARVIDNTAPHSLEYSRLDEAIACFNQLPDR